MPSTSLYLGGLPYGIKEEDVYRHLSIYGKVTAIDILSGYGFVEFASEADAMDVVATFSHRPFMGTNVKIQVARAPRRSSGQSNDTTHSPTRERRRIRAPSEYTDRAYDNRPEGPRQRYLVVVNNLNARTCWQELKDFARLAGGDVAFCNIDKYERGRGFIEYLNEEDATHAVRQLNGKVLLGNTLALYIDGPQPLHRQSRHRSRSPVRRSDTRPPYPRRRDPSPPYSRRHGDEHVGRHREHAVSIPAPDELQPLPINGGSPHDQNAEKETGAVRPAWPFPSMNQAQMSEDYLYASDERRAQMDQIALEWLAMQGHADPW